MITGFRKPAFAVFIVAVMSLYFVSPSAAAMIQFRRPHPEEIVSGGDIDAMQRALESRIIREKLQAYGMSADDITARLQTMTDRDVHLLAQASERVLAGGDSVAIGISMTIGALILVGMAIMFLHLFEEEVIVR